MRLTMVPAGGGAVGRIALAAFVALLAVSAVPAANGTAATPVEVVFGWGRNIDGELGNGESGSAESSPQPVKDSPGTDLLRDTVAVATGRFHSLAITETGALWSWGFNQSGQIGDGTQGDDRLLPVRVRDSAGTGYLADIEAVAGGSLHTIALSTDGRVWAWGNNFEGQLGDNTISNPRVLPGRVKTTLGIGSLSYITAIAAGAHFNLALTEGGEVWAWGKNTYGQLGDGTSGNVRKLPTKVKTPVGSGYLDHVVAISAGYDHSLALTDDGRVYAWGRNHKGQVGDGSDTLLHTRPVEVAVPLGAPGGAGTTTAIAAGGDHTLALTTAGTILAWGDNAKGQAGDGTSANIRKLPVAVIDPGTAQPLGGFVDVEAGTDFSVGVTGDGEAWAWGDNYLGSLGVGTSGDFSAEPVKILDSLAVAPLPGILQVSAGSSHALAILAPLSADLRVPMSSRSREIALTLEASGPFNIDGYYLSETPGAPLPGSDAWSPAPLNSFTLTPGEGVKTVYGYVRDDHDFVSAAVPASVVLDATAPTASLSIAPYTRGRRVKVSLSGFDTNGIVAYYLSTDFVVPPLDIAGWKSFMPKSFPLAGEDGTKTVYGWTRDAAGNVSATASDTTVQDRKKPSLAIAKPKRLARLPELKQISGTMSDPAPGSGLKSGRFAIRSKTGGECRWWRPAAGKFVAGECTKPLWLRLATQANWTRSIGKLDDPGAYALLVEARDRAGGVRKVSRRFAIVAAGAQP
jgi:alpha-tubulin suppressor-like RCC1 family protein